MYVTLDKTKSYNVSLILNYNGIHTMDVMEHVELFKEISLFSKHVKFELYLFFFKCLRKYTSFSSCSSPAEGSGSL